MSFATRTSTVVVDREVERALGSVSGELVGSRGSTEPLNGR